MNTQIRGLQIKDAFFGNGLQRNGSDSDIAELKVKADSGLVCDGDGLSLTYDLLEAFEVLFTEGFVNLVSNGSFEHWTAGDNVAPDDWTAVGTWTSVAKEATVIKAESFSALLTEAVGSEARLKQTIAGGSAPRSISVLAGKAITASAWVRWASGTTGVTKIEITDSVGTTSSSFAPVDSNWHLLTVTRTIDAGATYADVVMVQNWSGASYFDLVTCNIGNTAGINYYSKPVDGIPSTDMTSAVQASLGLADSSLQPGDQLTFKGTWSAGVYAVNDIVEYNGSAYVCLIPTTTQEPVVAPTYWGLFVAKGATGAKGDDGAPGDKGDKGDQGDPGVNPVGAVLEGAIAVEVPTVSAKTEYIMNTLAVANSVQVYLNGMLQEAGSGKDYIYSEAGSPLKSVITFAEATQVTPTVDVVVIRSITKS